MDDTKVKLKNILRTWKALARKLYCGLCSPFASLKELAIRHGTGKHCEATTFKGTSYMDIYSRYFKPFRNKGISLLEIGVYGGASLRLWKRYFPKGKIYGLDIDPACKQYNEDRIFIELGDQADEQSLERVCRKVDGFDIIIDDGSHVNKYTIKSFQYLFKKLKPGGLYIIEDLSCSYVELETMNVREIWPGMKYNGPDINLNNKRADMDRFFEIILHDMDHKKGEILTVQFYSQICFITKART